MKRIIIESPYAANDQRSVDEHVAYARACMVDSLRRGEAPLASHLLYTQLGILDDKIAADRGLGIAAGLAWAEVADRQVFYIDMGWSRGMMEARRWAERNQRLILERKLT